MSLSFLADENISPETADHLEALGLSCRSLRREGPWRLADSEIAALARREDLVILTHDLDFGEIFFLASDCKEGWGEILRIEGKISRNCCLNHPFFSYVPFSK